MVVTVAVRHHNGGSAEGDGESGGVQQSPLESARLHQTPLDSGGLPTKRSPVDWSTGLDSTRLHQTTVRLF